MLNSSLCKLKSWLTKQCHSSQLAVGSFNNLPKNSFQPAWTGVMLLWKHPGPRTLPPLSPLSRAEPHKWGRQVGDLQRLRKGASSPAPAQGQSLGAPWQENADTRGQKALGKEQQNLCSDMLKIHSLINELKTGKIQKCILRGLYLVWTADD